MNDKVKVLVVDDEEVIRKGCRRVLSGEDYEILTAENGQLAMDILNVESVDIMLLDLKMPVMSGEEVLERVNKQYPDIPVIVITGHGTIDTAVDCMKKGAYDFITKPFQVEQFIITVNRASDKRRLEQETKKFQEEKLRNLYDLGLEKSRLKTIINCMANGVMVTNRNLEMVLHNPALMRLLEISKEVEDPIEASSIVQNRELIESLQEILSGESREHEFISQEIELDNKTLRSFSAPAIGPDNELVGTVTVLEDITDFKRLDDMKSDFVNMVAHELRSPLGSIRQQNSVIIEGLAGPLNEKQQELMNKGVKKIDQLLELINELLDIAKIEAGKHTQRRVPLDLEQLVNDTISLMECGTEARGIEVTSECINLSQIVGDPKGIEEVLNNLITNAINYSPDNGNVNVKAQGLGEYVEIRVEDNGVGIDPEELPKIFDKFYRVKHPKTRQVVGTGLGLAIVKGIIEAHQGTIEVESIPEQGTTFKILLPILTADEK